MKISKIIKQLNEDAKSDALHRKLANVAFVDTKKALAKLKNKNIEYKDFKLRVTTRSDYGRIIYNLYFYPRNTRLAAEYDAEEYKKSFKHIIHMYCVDVKPDEDIVSGEDLYNQVVEWKEHFIHEFIHLLDDVRSDHHLSQDSALSMDATEDEYYNDPYEYNAYIQQAMSIAEDEIEKEYNNILIKSKHTKNIPSLFWKRLVNFNEFMKYYMSWYENRIVPKLYKKFQKKYLKRMYNFWIYIKEEIKNKVILIDHLDNLISKNYFKQLFDIKELYEKIKSYYKTYNKLPVWYDLIIINNSKDYNQNDVNKIIQKFT